MNSLALEMIRYDKGDARRINHFIKVHGYAMAIADAEGVDERTKEILSAAAYTHDIGIKVSEEKYGSASGYYQQIEGPDIAEEMLTRLSFDRELVERVMFLIAHHHNYAHIDGMDYQILVEADFIVNVFEGDVTAETAKGVREKVFKTKTGIEILDNLYGTEMKS